jgi:hypothetical protein
MILDLRFQILQFAMNNFEDGDNIRRNHSSRSPLDGAPSQWYPLPSEGPR